MNYETFKEDKTIEAFGLKTRVWAFKEYGYGCSECCYGDRCDEDCTALYYRPNCPHCKGRGWIPANEAKLINDNQ